ncbi:melanocyte-stimulating hormone receptor-like [Oculina patagonica]
MNNTVRNNNESADFYINNQGNHIQKTVVMMNYVLNTPLMLISILGNALVLAAVMRTPSIRSTSMVMLCSLAVSDLLVGLIAQPLHIARYLTEDRFVYHAAHTVGFSLCGVSLLTITAITVDRFLALRYHMRYATLVTESRVRYVLVIIWLAGFGLSSSELWHENALHLIAAVVTVICLTISTFCYITIYRTVRRHQSQIHAQQQSFVSSNIENNASMMRLKKSSMSTFVFYFFLIMCYFPMYTILTLNGFHGISGMDRTIQWAIASTAVFMNSSINPFLYFWRLREIRMAVVKTAKQMFCKQTEEN